MLTDPNLRSKVDQIWDRLWSSGLSNPMARLLKLEHFMGIEVGELKKLLETAKNE